MNISDVLSVADIYSAPRHSTAQHSTAKHTTPRKINQRRRKSEAENTAAGSSAIANRKALPPLSFLFFPFRPRAPLRTVYPYYPFRARARTHPLRPVVMPMKTGVWHQSVFGSGVRVEGLGWVVGRCFVFVMVGICVWGARGW